MLLRRFAIPALGLFLLSGAGRVSAVTLYPRLDSPLANTTILVIRHAEKPEEGDGLTPAGEARAKAYAGYFDKLRIDGKPFHIDHIFATADSKGSHRPRLTVEPLGASLHLPVDVRFHNKEYEALAQDLKTHPYGKGILICWHHGNIPNLVTALGAPAGLVPGGKWPSGTYDWVVELKFDSAGALIPADAKIIHEHLMPGDAK